MKHWKPINLEKLSGDTKKVYEILNFESDLACVLIGTTYLSELFANIIEVSFIKTSITGKILDPRSGALGQFATRTDLAYCLGLINKNVYQDLGIIGEIRNVLAHKHLSLDFNDKIVKEKCEKLKAWRMLPAKGEKSTVISQEEIRIQARNQFNFSVILRGQRIHVDAISKKNNKKL